MMMKKGTKRSIAFFRLVAAKRKNPLADTSGPERQIDGLVYALYGLTPEEVKIVEAGSKG